MVTTCLLIFLFIIVSVSNFFALHAACVDSTMELLIDSGSVYFTRLSGHRVGSCSAPSDSKVVRGEWLQSGRLKDHDASSGGRAKHCSS